jgi:Kef-type K+ transport system membrane component KefB
VLSVPSDLLSSIGICVAAAALLALAGHRLRQPLILAYLVTGVLIGPVGFDLVKDRESIQTVAEIGLILLLFMIGLEIDLKKLVAAGRPVLVAGALQVPICIGIGLAFFYWLGFRDEGGQFALLYLAACLSMSSTLIVVKLLYDKRELDTLPGRITLGILVCQDLWAVAMLAVQPNLLHPDAAPLLLSLLKGLLLVLWSLAVSRYILPRLFRAVARQPELVLTTALAWCFFLAGAANFVGLSREMGALIAGISLSTFPYNIDVAAKVTNLRDFFITLFFVALGMQIPVPSLGIVLVALAAGAFLLLSRAVIFPILYALGMGHRVSLVTSINLAQISEFSIVIASLGLARGQISAPIVSIVIITFAVTSVATTYLVGSNDAIAEAISWLLKRIRIHDLDRVASGEAAAGHPDFGLVFLGFFRDASSILFELESAKWGSARRRLLEETIVIDFNPDVIRELKKRNVHCIYGDIAHIDTLRHAHVRAPRLVVSTITDEILRGTTNLRILHSARRLWPDAAVLVTTEHIPQAMHLYAEGADFVYLPRLHSAEQIAEVIETAMETGLGGVRDTELAELKRRREVVG